MPHLKLGVLHPKRLFNQTAGNESARRREEAEISQAKANPRQKKAIDRVDHGAVTGKQPVLKQVVFAAETQLIPPSTLRLSPESLTPASYNKPIDYIKSKLLDAASGEPLADEIFDVLDALLYHNPLDTELLTLRVIANRCTRNVADCIQDCEQILQNNPEHREALLYRAAAWLEPFSPHRGTIKEGVRAKLAAEAWILLHPTDFFGMLLSTTAVGNYKTRPVTESHLNGLFNKNPHQLGLGQLLYAFQCKMFSYHPSQDLLDRSQVTARKLCALDENNTTTLRMLGRLSEVNFPDTADISTRQFLNWPLLQQDPDLINLLAVSQPA